MHRVTRPLLLAACSVLCFSALALAQAKPDIAGWEKGSAYDKLFDAKEMDSIKGHVDDIIDITPMPGMAPGVGLVIRDKKDNKEEIVHLGPKSFVNLGSIGLRKGEAVKVYGAWATIGGKDVLMATKVKKEDDKELKVRRSQDGAPWWTMSPEELAKEKKGD